VPAVPAPSGSLLTEEDLYLFHEGSHFYAQAKLGAHPSIHEGTAGVQFGVWAPNAASGSVVGDFNSWDGAANPLAPRGTGGVWEGFVPGIGAGAVYKYRIVSRLGGYKVDKADPYGFMHEVPPRTASVVAELDFEWTDREWMASRAERQKPEAPLVIYEVHLGSWRRGLDGKAPGYRELAGPLADYALELSRGVTRDFKVQPQWRDEFYRRLVAKGVALDRAQYTAAGRYVDRLLEQRVARLVAGDSTAKRRDIPFDAPLRKAVEVMEKGQSQRDLFTIAAATRLSDRTGAP